MILLLAFLNLNIGTFFSYRFRKIIIAINEMLRTTPGEIILKSIALNKTESEPNKNVANIEISKKDINKVFVLVKYRSIC